jgi:galactose oxidase
MYDATAGKILTAGGSPAYQGAPALDNAYVITIGTPGTQPTVQKVQDMNYPRIFHCGVALPNGQVFVVGGQDYGTPLTDDFAMMYPEIWTPSTQQWTLLAPMAVPRNYHSVAILMPDATILSGGGGLCDGCMMNHYDAQIFNPPYLFTSSGARATRPVITSVSVATVKVGNSLTFVTNGPVTNASIIRMGTTTHTVNTDQRRIPLLLVPAGVNTYQVTIPKDPGVALPGYWMLFAMNLAGVPSISKTVKSNVIF